MIASRIATKKRHTRQRTDLTREKALDYIHKAILGVPLSDDRAIGYHFNVSRVGEKFEFKRRIFREPRYNPPLSELTKTLAAIAQKFSVEHSSHVPGLIPTEMSKVVAYFKLPKQLR
ncbi:MAG: hypothetical protein WC607_01875 [Candidatus Micrarchaeia archaeon]